MSEAPEENAELEVIQDDADAAPDVSGETDDALEEEALAMGWKPLSQFKGPKDKFVSAAEYVERGKTIMPFLRKELSQAYKKIEGLEKSVTNAVKHLTAAEKRGYEKAKRDLEAELEQFAAAGDAAGVKAVTQDIVNLEKEVSAAPGKDEPELPPELQAWMDDNPWYGKDKALTAACEAIGQEVFEEGYTGKAQIKEVDRRIREAFPNKFAKPENPARKAPAAVEGGSSAPRKSGKSYAELPAEAKQFCDELVRDKIMTREKYVATYDWS